MKEEFKMEIANMHIKMLLEPIKFISIITIGDSIAGIMSTGKLVTMICSMTSLSSLTSSSSDFSVSVASGSLQYPSVYQL